MKDLIRSWFHGSAVKGNMKRIITNSTPTRISSKYNGKEFDVLGKQNLRGIEFRIAIGRCKITLLKAYVIFPNECRTTSIIFSSMLHSMQFLQCPTCKRWSILVESSTPNGASKQVTKVINQALWLVFSSLKATLRAVCSVSDKSLKISRTSLVFRAQPEMDWEA